MGAETKHSKGLLNLTASMTIFGTIGIFVRYIPLSSSVIAMARGFIGTIFLLVVTAVRKTRVSIKDIKSNLLILCVSGIFIGFNWILLFEAYRYTTVAIATLCYYFAPIFVVIASQVLYKEKLTTVRAICILLAFCGMMLVSGVFMSNGGFNIKGVLLGLGAAVLYASVVLMNKRLRNISVYDTTVVQLAAAVIILVPYTLLTNDCGAIRLAPAPLVLLVVLGIIHTGFAYMLYFSSIEKLKAQTVAIFSYIDPVVAIILSALILRERMDAFGVIGAVLILGSAFCSETLGKPKEE